MNPRFNETLPPVNPVVPEHRETADPVLPLVDDLPRDDADSNGQRPRRDFPERPALGGRQGNVVSAGESDDLYQVITKTIEQYRMDPEATVTLTRLRPDRHPKTGTEIRGHTDTWYIADFRTADELLNRIKDEHGGTKWDIKFQARSHPTKGGKKFTRAFQIAINAPPVIPKSDEEEPPKKVGVTPGGNSQTMEAAKLAIEAHKNRAQDAITLASEMRKSIGSSGTADIQKVMELNREHNREIDRMQERFDRDKHSLEQRIERLDEANRRALDDHRREVAHLREMHQGEMTRMQGMVEAEKRGAERLRDEFGINTKTQLEAQKANFEYQIQTLNERLRNTEDRSHDLEKERDRLQRDLFDERSKQPDALGSVMASAAQIKDVASVFGYSKESSEPRESDLASALRVAKETGITDGVGKVATQILTAMRRPPTPAFVQPVPIDPTTGQPVVQPPTPAGAPPQAVAAVSGPAQPAAPPPAPNVRPSAPPAPPQAAERPTPPPSAPSSVEVVQDNSNVEKIDMTTVPEGEKEIVMALIVGAESEMQSGSNAEAVANAFVTQIPDEKIRETVKKYAAYGPARFMTVIEQLQKDSALLSVTGEKWVQTLFAALSAQLPSS